MEEVETSLLSSFGVGLSATARTRAQGLFFCHLFWAELGMPPKLNNFVARQLSHSVAFTHGGSGLGWPRKRLAKKEKWLKPMQMVHDHPN